MTTIFDRSPREPASSRYMFVGTTATIVTLAAFGSLWPFADRWLWSGAIPRGAIIQLTAERAYEGLPSLSPDGEWISYRSDATGNGDILVRNIDSGRIVNLTQGWMLDESDPAFSPDGRSIAFRSRQGGDGIHVISRTGGQARRITRGGAAPAWTPDGRFIVYATQGSLDRESACRSARGSGSRSRRVRAPGSRWEISGSHRCRHTADAWPIGRCPSIGTTGSGSSRREGTSGPSISTAVTRSASPTMPRATAARFGHLTGASYYT